MIEAQLPAHWRSIARAHGLAPSGSPPPGAKVTDISTVLRMVLFHVAANVSLATTTAMAAAAGLTTLSAVALHKWMRRIGPFFAALLAAMTETARQFAAERWKGYQILITDASVVTRPGSEGVTARVHYMLRLSDLRVIDVQVTDEKKGESWRRFAKQACAMQLWLGDRVYANPPGIAAVRAKGADVLVRWNRGALPLYDIDGKPLDVSAKLMRLSRPGETREWAAWVHPQDGPKIGGRLCAVRLPFDKAEEARARARREQGSKVTAETLALAEFVVVFTTVPKPLMPTYEILELYRLRWQLELSIKRDKSIAGLDRLPNFRPDTIQSWILAKLLLIQIARKTSTPEVCLPPCAAA